MEQLLDKPAGTVIQESQGPEGVTYAWKVLPPRSVRFVPAVIIGLWLCGWVFMGGFALVHMIADTPEFAGAPVVFIVLWFALWAAGSVAAGWVVWSVIRPARPEAVTLGEALIRYNPGRIPGLPPWMFWWWWVPQYHTGRDPLGLGAARHCKPVTMPRSELKGFVLGRAGERQRLAFDHGADRVEIGACLREPEREWLHAVLERWRLG